MDQPNLFMAVSSSPLFEEVNQANISLVVLDQMDNQGYDDWYL